MTQHQIVQRATQRSGVQPAGNPHRTRHHIGHAVRIEFPQEPQPLLSKRKGMSTVMILQGDDGQLADFNTILSDQSTKLRAPVGRQLRIVF
jgi:hypothetical protein